MIVSLQSRARFSVRSKIGKNSFKPRYHIFLNILAFLLVMSAITLISWGTGKMTLPLSQLKLEPISLDLWSLCNYSMRTILRMFLGIIVSLIFTLLVATLAAKNKYAEQILIPVLDVLQSVPILGYISFTFTAFLALFPGSQMGPEMAAIFAIFTSQVWNMTFSLYQSLKTLPIELSETAIVFEMDGWSKFWKIEVPFAMPSLIWNIVMSMSSGWFYVVASEVIMVGNNRFALPGIGSYISLAIVNEDVEAVIAAIIAMTLVIVLYDQLILRPLIVWADKFRYEMSSNSVLPTSWMYSVFIKNLYIKKLFFPLKIVANFVLHTPSKFIRLFNKTDKIVERRTVNNRLGNNYYWGGFLIISVLTIVYYLANFIYYVVGVPELLYVLKLGSYTLARVLILTLIASLIWLPIGIYIGLNPTLTKIFQPLTQFLSSFPANIFFPILVVVITHYKLNPDIWLSPLMIIGSQWYILFNVIAGTTSLPGDLKEVIKNFEIKGSLLWKKIILPTITPYFITGAITACGATWNASIVSEFINYGDKTIMAQGLGSYIAAAALHAEFAKVALGVCMMAFFVVCFDKFFWGPINDYATRKFQL